MMLEDNMKDTIGLVWNAATKDGFFINNTRGRH